MEKVLSYKVSWELAQARLPHEVRKMLDSLHNGEVPPHPLVGILAEVLES